MGLDTEGMIDRMTARRAFRRLPLRRTWRRFRGVWRG